MKRLRQRSTKRRRKTSVLATGRLRIVYLAALCVAVLTSCEETAACPEDPPLISLIDHEEWQQVPMEDDPFTSSADGEIYPCDERDITVEELTGITTWSVITGACNWATVSQPLPRDLAAGDELFVELFWFSQRDFPGAIANIALSVGADVVLTHQVEVPADAELLETTVEVPTDAAAGTPLTFHVGNHGTNSWNLMDVSLVNDVERPAWCPAPEEGA